MTMTEYSKCIGCGFCCTKAKCVAGARLYPAADICLALQWNGERHICDLMELPGILGETYRKELYAGEGCCMGLNTWRQEPLQDRTKTFDKHTVKSQLSPLMQKFIACLGHQFISGDVIVLAILELKDRLIKDGMDEKETISLCKEILSKFKEQRSSFKQDFMG